MRRILFLSEAVTWSQVVRLVVLARSLDPARFAVSFAAARFDERLFGDAAFARHTLSSLTPEQVDARLARGGRIYDRATLAGYVDEELRLFEELQPDLVVSDLRWSTCVSAPLAQVKLATLIDAYWFRDDARFPIPDHPAVRFFGAERVKHGFARALPFVMRHFAAPVNALRQRHGLPRVGELRDVLGFGDRLLFPDEPALAPSNRAGTYLGPVLWAPELPLPPWWSEVGVDRPLVYATLGSSGPIEILPRLLEALGGLDVDVVLSSAARAVPRALPARVRLVEAIRGDLAARRASAVVCSGGASSGWQALAEGRPIVGIPSNLDACLAMSCIEEAGAGIGLRPTASVAQLRAAIVRALEDPSLRAASGAVARSFAQLDAPARFRAAVDEMLA